MRLRRLLVSGVACIFWLGGWHVFADSITLTNLQSIAAPFGGLVVQVAINDSGEIAGTTYAGGTQAGFVIPAGGGPPVQIIYAGGSYTYVNGVNDQGTLVGDSLTSGGITGFSYSGSAFTLITVATFTFPQSINNNGDIAGSYSSSDTGTGFLIKNGVTTTFSVAGHPLDTYATGINDSDQVVGYYNGGANGFLRQSNGTIQTFDFSAEGINDAGVIVGIGPGGNDTSSGRVLIGNTEYTFTYPGAVDTYIDGINNNGEVVGIYYDSAFVSHIFVGQLPATAAVPEPSSLPVCAGLLTLAAVGVHFRNRRLKRT